MIIYSFIVSCLESEGKQGVICMKNKLVNDDQCGVEEFDINNLGFSDYSIYGTCDNKYYQTSDFHNLSAALNIWHTCFKFL